MGTADQRSPADLDTFWTHLVQCRNHVPSVLRVIAQQVVDVLGDGCVLTTLTDDGTALHPSAVLHADPEVAQAMEAVLSRSETRLGEGLAGSVAADRRAILLNDVPPEDIAETTPQRFLPFLRDHPMKAIMIVPLAAAGELLGTLGALRTDSDEPYTPADLRVLEALAERAALAMAEAVAAPRSVGAADYEAIFVHNLDGVLLTTPDGHILAANPAACEILHLTEREITHRGREGLMVADARLHRALEERTRSGQARSELAMRRGDGTTFEADVSSTIFTTPEGKVRACVIFRDVSQQVAAREATLERVAELEHVADRDPLTNLWNRRGFFVAAEEALAVADHRGVRSQVLFVDLDGLKALNDAYGHAAGDAAIVALGAAIQRATREVDVACRLGGDEFVVLLVDSTPEAISRIVERIDAELAVDALVPAPLGFSTGVVERPAGTDATLAALIEAADRDMYQEKVLRRLRIQEGPRRAT